MSLKASQLITVFYDPDGRRVWSGGKFVSLEEFVRYPPSSQADAVARGGEGAVDDPGTEPEPGPELKCIEGQEHICYLSRCFPTGRSC
jgi:hypothetical protein